MIQCLYAEVFDYSINYFLVIGYIREHVGRGFGRGFYLYNVPHNAGVHVFSRLKRKERYVVLAPFRKCGLVGWSCFGNDQRMLRR